LPHVADCPLDFAFLPSCRYMACPRNESIFPREGEKPRIETYEIALMFGDDRGEIVVPQFPCDASHRIECMDMTADESLERLAVCELQIQLPGVTLHQSEGIEFAWCAVVDECAEMRPVDLKSFAGGRLHADEGASRLLLAPHVLQIILHNRVAPPVKPSSRKRWKMTAALMEES